MLYYIIKTKKTLKIENSTEALFLTEKNLIQSRSPLIILETFIWKQNWKHKKPLERN